MTDVAPELLEQIQERFNNKLKGNHKITVIYNKMRDGKKLTYEDANTFAEEVGGVLAWAFKRTFSPSTLPDGKMYYNIADRVVRPMLVGNYGLISEVAEQTQKSLNKAAGIKLATKKAEINESRVQGLVDKVSSYDDYSEAAWVLDEPVVNFSQSVVDDFVKTNIDFQYKAGLNPKIKRTLASGCCDWCQSLVGEFDYPNDVPEDIYRRHEFCRCTVTFEPAKGKYQGVHSKRTYTSAHQAEIEERKHLAKLDEEKRKSRR